MTRAEDCLFIGGALNKSQLKAQKIGEDCWHSRVGEALRQLKANEQDGSLIFSRREKLGGAKPKPVVLAEGWQGPLPSWSTSTAPQEARPARPLAPSALGVADVAASPPPDPAMKAAAVRGTLLHGLFERLPAVRAEDRRAAGLLWLGAQGAEDPAELIEAALSVIEHPDFAAIFGPSALAEAPLAGVVEGAVIAGIVDRLLIEDDQVLVIDFKTGRRVPNDAAAVPDYYKAQMGAYTAVLQGIFPGRAVRAALLYTAAPKLIELSAAELGAWRPKHSG